MTGSKEQQLTVPNCSLGIVQQAIAALAERQGSPSSDIELWVIEHTGGSVKKASIKEALKEGVELGVLTRKGFKQGYPCYKLAMSSRNRQYWRNAAAATSGCGDNGSKTSDGDDDENTQVNTRPRNRSNKNVTTPKRGGGRKAN